MISKATKSFWKLHDALDERIQRQARASYLLFRDNPYHPSLHFKKVHDTMLVYSARVNLNYRALGVIESDEIVWFWIGAHDAYERIIANL